MECAAKDSDIKRLTQKLTAATAAADSESDQGLTQEDVEAAVSQACAPNTCLDTDRSGVMLRILPAMRRLVEMARREEHLQDELEALQQRLDSLQRKLAQIPETKPAAAPKPAPQEPDAVAQQILAEAARTVESAEAELAGYKVEHAKQMEQVQELNAELNAEATKLRGKDPCALRQALRCADTLLFVLSGALDHAFKTQQQLSEGHASAIAALEAENKRLKSRLSGGSKRKDGEAAELRTQLKAKERTLSEQEVAVEKLRKDLTAAKRATHEAKAQLTTQQTGKVHQQLSEAERRIAELTESEASLKKLLEARQRGLSHAIDRVTRQDKELTAARAALRTKTGKGVGKSTNQRDGWLGEGRSLAVGDRCTVVEDHEAGMSADTPPERHGEVVFLGPTELGEGQWAGVCLDLPLGKHDGRVRGRRYFDCKDKHGVLVRPSKLRRTDPGAHRRSQSIRVFDCPSVY